MSNEKDYEKEIKNDDAIDAIVVDDNDESKSDETGFSFGQ